MTYLLSLGIQIAVVAVVVVIVLLLVRPNRQESNETQGTLERLRNDLSLTQETFQKAVSERLSRLSSDLREALIAHSTSSTQELSARLGEIREELARKLPAQLSELAARNKEFSAEIAGTVRRIPDSVEKLAGLVRQGSEQASRNLERQAEGTRRAIAESGFTPAQREAIESTLSQVEASLAELRQRPTDVTAAQLAELRTGLELRMVEERRNIEYALGDRARDLEAAIGVRENSEPVARLVAQLATDQANALDHDRQRRADELHESEARVLGAVREQLVPLAIIGTQLQALEARLTALEKSLRPREPDAVPTELSSPGSKAIPLPGTARPADPSGMEHEAGTDPISDFVPQG